MQRRLWRSLVIAPLLLLELALASACQDPLNSPATEPTADRAMQVSGRPVASAIFFASGGEWMTYGFDPVRDKVSRPPLGAAQPVCLSVDLVSPPNCPPGATSYD